MTPRATFPARLLRALDHAQGFAHFLARLDAGRLDVMGRAWLLGRRREVAAFVARIGRDYRRRKLDEAAATACIDAYLAALHAGVATHFGVRSPDCCKTSAAVTVVAPHALDSTPTHIYTRRPAPASPAPALPTESLPDADTWVDIQADQLLAGLHHRPR